MKHVIMIMASHSLYCLEQTENSSLIFWLNEKTSRMKKAFLDESGSEL